MMIVDTHEPSVALSCREAYNKIVRTKFTSKATWYYSTFQRDLQNFRNAATSLESLGSVSLEYSIQEAYIYLIYLEGTKHIDSSDTWRETGAVDNDQHVFARYIK